jgi:MarR family transcriptional regulator for hemolysin
MYLSMKPSVTPIGLLLSQTAKRVGREFDNVLTAAGGSAPTWLVLMALMGGERRTQAELALVVGIQGPTLTHHLNAMETAGLVTRSRRPDNRRVHDVALTEAGRAMFHRLRGAAAAHDARLRKPFSASEIEVLRDLLARMADAVAVQTEGPR